MKHSFDHKFEEHDAVIYKDNIARIEDIAKYIDGRTIYLIQTCDRKYFYAYEDELQEYIG